MFHLAVLAAAGLGALCGHGGAPPPWVRALLWLRLCRSPGLAGCLLPALPHCRLPAPEIHALYSHTSALPTAP